jgi:methionyl aminopeptidase
MASSSSSRSLYREAELIPIKSADEIKLMRETCRIAAVSLETMAQSLEVGMTTYDLDLIGKKAIESQGAISACFGYSGSKGKFPCYTCISINDEVVHGVSRLDRCIEDGDIVSLDVVVRYKGFVGDNARSLVVGTSNEKKDHLLATTKTALEKGIEKASKGNRVGDISHSIQKFVENEGFSVIREFVGHGVGLSMHEPPQIPNFGRRHTGPVLAPGMTLAIEPMVNMGSKEVAVLDDGWTVITKDGLPSAHFEHTILILSDGVEVLTTPN